MFVFFASSPYRVYYVWSVSSSVLPLSSSRIFAGVLEQCRPLLQEAAVLECMGVERRKKICSEQPGIMLGRNMWYQGLIILSHCVNRSLVLQSA
jgi:hypothetical protein